MYFVPVLELASDWAFTGCCWCSSLYIHKHTHCRKMSSIAACMAACIMSWGAKIRRVPGLLEFLFPTLRVWRRHKLQRYPKQETANNGPIIMIIHILGHSCLCRYFNGSRPRFMLGCQHWRFPSAWMLQVLHPPKGLEVAWEVWGYTPETGPISQGPSAMLWNYWDGSSLHVCLLFRTCAHLRSAVSKIVFESETKQHCVWKEPRGVQKVEVGNPCKINSLDSKNPLQRLTIFRE